MTQQEKPITWNTLKSFIETLNENQLNLPVMVCNTDESFPIIEAGIREKIYYNIDDSEDVWTEWDYEIACVKGLIEEPKNYKMDDSKPPYLSSEH